jgi:Mn2+/Fe2+ NRAMP family transporter
MISNISSWLILLVLGLSAFLILSISSLQKISQVMGALVALMGLVFLYMAITVAPSFVELASNSLIPQIPADSSVLILGLIGTTIIPYNLFLGGSFSSKANALREAQVGLSIAIILGGVISMSVLIVGTLVVGEFSFEVLAEALELKFGASGRYILAFGLLGAGFTSTVTATLAAAITAQSLFGNMDKQEWQTSGIYFRAVWMAILLIGLGSGLSGVKPIPVIIFVQALNGFILPLLVFLLIRLVNDANILPQEQRNGIFGNTLLLITLVVTTVLGMNSLLQVITNVWGKTLLNEIQLPLMSVTVFLVILCALWQIYHLSVSNKNK